MTPEQIKQYEQAAQDGSLPDEENPLFLFAKTGTNLLVKLLAKEVNVFALIKMNLKERGVDEKGRWVGFERPKSLKRKPGV